MATRAKITPQLWEAEPDEWELFEFSRCLGKRSDLAQFARLGRGLALELGRRWGVDALPKWSIHSRNDNLTMELWGRLAGSLLSSSGRGSEKFNWMQFQMEERFGKLEGERMAAWRECCALARLGIGGEEARAGWRSDAVFMSIARRMDWARVSGEAALAFAVACGRVAKAERSAGDGGLAQWMGERGFRWSQALAEAMARECFLGSEARTKWHMDCAAGGLRGALAWAGKGGSAPSGELAILAWEALRADMAQELIAAGADVSAQEDLPARLLSAWKAADARAGVFAPAGVAEFRRETAAKAAAAWEASCLAKAAPAPGQDGRPGARGRRI